jgi:ribosome-binding protein aMBF1 (putative translation factor)
MLPEGSFARVRKCFISYFGIFGRGHYNATLFFECVADMTRSIFTNKYKDLCHLLIQARESQGLTQARVAERLNRPQSFVSKYENGERRLDVIEFLEVAAALGVQAESLLAIVEDKGKRRNRQT